MTSAQQVSPNRIMPAANAGRSSEAPPPEPGRALLRRALPSELPATGTVEPFVAVLGYN